MQEKWRKLTKMSDDIADSLITLARPLLKDLYPFHVSLRLGQLKAGRWSNMEKRATGRDETWCDLTCDLDMELFSLISDDLCFQTVRP